MVESKLLKHDRYLLPHSREVQPSNNRQCLLTSRQLMWLGQDWRERFSLQQEKINDLYIVLKQAIKLCNNLVLLE